ncbi:hypothetical protein EYF80_052576 [Liparis tanakae]|uniref:Uncharacterized protein n=1 Tax=Liparis tanakae TaxID=230148 RepID=A0A4Z2F7Y7_9TELE|nr:hypothetical protein EYF80_052576 [Liparis tanakae]
MSANQWQLNGVIDDSSSNVRRGVSRAIDEFKPERRMDEERSPSPGAGGAAASSSTEHSDSRGTLML